jgi:protein-S-isoprenylcysteine O-methyltransferase Ste14
MTDNAVQSRQGGARVRVPPPLTFAAAIVVGFFLPGLRLQGHHAGRIAAGALLLAAGLALGFPAVARFRRTGQDPAPWKPTPELVFEGPFRYTRNPMYVGMVLLTLAAAAFSGRGFIALLAPVALAVVHYTAVLREEAYLSSKFGEPYLAYKAKVRRYL